MGVGGVAGCVAKTVVAPMERARLLAQTGATERGFLSTVSMIYRGEGARGLWRGNGANCLRVFPAKAILFAGNDYYKGALRGVMGQDSQAAAFLSGSIAGITAAFVTYPLDVTRMRMSATRIGGDGSGSGGDCGRARAAARAVHASFFQVGRQVWKTGGLRGFYRGIVPTSMGAVPYEGIKFGVFDLLRSLWIASSESEVSSSPEDGLDATFADDERMRGRRAGAEAKLPMVAKLTCGALAGIAGGAIMYPNDTVRRRMQVAGAMRGSEGDRVFTGPLDCARDTYRRGGVRRFYRGIGPYLVRMVPNAAIQFAVYESLRDLL